MSPLRSLFSVALVMVAAGAFGGCKKDEPAPPAKPDPATSARDKGKLSLRNPISPVAKIDPQTMKEYRMDVCYFGSLTLKQARDAYMASLGKDEPSEKKIPSFGAAPKPGDAKAAGSAAAGAPKPSGTPTAKPAAGGTAAPAPKPAGSGAPAARPVDPRMPQPAGPLGDRDRDMRRPFDVSLRAPHERNARACTVAAGHKEPAMPEVDPAVQAFAPYAVELAKNIAAASAYYQREEYKKDSFAKGKELHKKLTDDFAKLDDLSDKLGAAIDKWRKEHPADASKQDEPEKIAGAAFDDARNLMLAAIAKKPDVAGYKANLEKLEKSVEALKTYGTGHAADPWPKIMAPAMDAFLKTAKDATDKVTEKGVENDTFLSLITSFTSLIEAKQRALSRAMIAKGQTADPTPPAGAAPGAAAPPPEKPKE
jgi:hypothetical protein